MSEPVLATHHQVPLRTRELAFCVWRPAVPALQGGILYADGQAARTYPLHSAAA